MTEMLMLESMPQKYKHVRTSAYERHGLRNTPEYENWHNMKQRCLNPRDKRYKNYGAKGIGVCNAWKLSFLTFLNDMGKRPSPSHSIDRINNTKGYSPNNCRWADKTQQIINRRKNKNNTSGYRGVGKKNDKWLVRVWINYKTYSFGNYADIEEAAHVYDQVMLQLYGNEAFTNFSWEKLIIDGLEFSA